MSQNQIKISKTTLLRIVFSMLILMSIFILWIFYYKNDKRVAAELPQSRVDTLAESPQEAIDLKQQEFFLKHENTETESDKTDENGKASNDPISFCNKICPSNYIMSVDCEYCFMFGQWRSDFGQKELVTGRSLKM